MNFSVKMCGWSNPVPPCWGRDKLGLSAVEREVNLARKNLTLFCGRISLAWNKMDEERLRENERLQIQLIRELDMEELEVEEIDGPHESSSDGDSDSLGEKLLLLPFIT